MKKILVVILVLLFVFAFIRITTSICENLKRRNDAQGIPVPNQDVAVHETKTDCDIIEISVDHVRGITQQEAEKLCYSVFGEKDEETGFIFSFGTSGAVKTEGKQYYVIRASWLVNNSHWSYIGDFFVSADGKEIYGGTALSDEYTMENVIWRE